MKKIPRYEVFLDELNIQGDIRKSKDGYMIHIKDLEALKRKFDKFMKNKKDIPPEFVELVNKNFWDLI